MDEPQNPSRLPETVKPILEEEFLPDFESDILDGKTIDDESIEKEKLRKKLRFFFMNPVEKWQTKRKFPFKLLVLLGKIIFVTVQLYLFARHRTSFIDYMFHSGISFSHLFLQGWDSTREVTTYPPQSGDLAVYRSAEFYSAIDFAVINYVDLPEESVGSYGHVKANGTTVPIRFCIRRYEEFSFLDSNETDFFLNDTILTNCVEIDVATVNPRNFSSALFFRQRNVTVDFPSMVDARISFLIKTVGFQSVPPGCLKFNVTIYFDNRAKDGRIKLSLDLTVDRLECRGNADEGKKSAVDLTISSLNFLVIVLCLLSGVLCLRAIWRAQLLRRKTVFFFRKYRGKDLSWEGHWEFWNCWYVTMIVSDLHVLIGSAMKERIEKNQFTVDEWNACGIVLGLGNFLLWFSVLRYLCFFKNYNTIILTMRGAAPALFRFMVCVLLIYSGFTFCGWLVLGPYHKKFRTLSGTSECLFALINGDDVFGTFSTLEPTKSDLIWWFCRIYLYSFISLFIYVVLSLFLSVLVDVYEGIKHNESEMFPKSDVRQFMEGDSERDLISMASSSIADYSAMFRVKPETLKMRNLAQMICCCKHTNSSTEID